MTTSFRTSNLLKQTLVQQSLSTGIETELLSNNVNREGGMFSIIKYSHSLPVIVEGAYPGFFYFYDPLQGPKLASSFLSSLFVISITS
jgi:hypothetical protein